MTREQDAAETIAAAIRDAARTIANAPQKPQEPICGDNSTSRDTSGGGAQSVAQRLWKVGEVLNAIAFDATVEPVNGDEWGAGYQAAAENYTNMLAEYRADAPGIDAILAPLYALAEQWESDYGTCPMGHAHTLHRIITQIKENHR